MPRSPDTNNLSLLRGVVFIGRHEASVLNGFSDVGEADKYDYVEADISEVEQFTSRDGTGGKVKGTVTKVVPKVEISGQELSTFNMAISALGLEKDFNQSSGSVTDTPFIAAAKKGKTYFTPHQDLSALVLKKGVTPLVLGTDYTVNLKAGWVHLLASGVTVVELDALVISYTFPVLTRKAVSPYSVKRINASVRYVGASADGQVFDSKVWNMLIKPSGPFSMIHPPDTSEYGRWSIQGDVLTDAGGAYGGSSDYPFAQHVEVGQVTS